MNEPRSRGLVVLISGRGSNMRALIEHGRASGGVYRVDLVICDRPDAPGLDAATALGVPARALVAPRDRGRQEFEHKLASAIEPLAPALIVLAGFMRILSADFVARYPGQIMNLHPSLLPKYPGLHTHRRALAAGDREHGATVHFVTAELDGGPPIVQARVPIQPGDDETSLAARVLAAEHRIYPLAVNWYCTGRLACRDGRAWLDGRALDAPVQYGGGMPGA